MKYRLFCKDGKYLGMDNTGKQFVEIISKSIRNDNNIEYYEDINWSNSINLAGHHNGEGVIN